MLNAMNASGDWGAESIK